MPQFQCELDSNVSAIKVHVVDDGGEKCDCNLSFDPRSGHYDYDQLAELENRFGLAWIETLEARVRKLIDEAVMTRRRAERDDPWGA